MSVKRALKKSVGKISLSFIQLQTVLSEIEAVLNSRPIDYVGEEFDADSALTPAHFLMINSKVGMSKSVPVSTHHRRDIASA